MIAKNTNVKLLNSDLQPPDFSLQTPKPKYDQSVPHILRKATNIYIRWAVQRSCKYRNVTIEE